MNLKTVSELKLLLKIYGQVTCSIDALINYIEIILLNLPEPKENI